MAAIKSANLGSLTPQQKRARLDSIMVETAVASIQHSLPSYRSGLRCWISFYNEMTGENRPLPPSVELLVMWSQFFRCSGSYANYLSHVRWATEACMLSTACFEHNMIKRAKRCVRAISTHRQKRWIKLELVEKLMSVAAREGAYNEAALYALSYIFLCRVGSELLPVVIQHENREPITNCHSVLIITKTRVTLKLQRRKNEPKGALICRTCYCGKSQQCCPVHTLAKWAERFEHGESPFAGITSSRAVGELRRRLAACEIENTSEFALHTFRRGAATDMAAWGYTVRAIMLAGGWRSFSFLLYMNEAELDVVAATQHAVEQSDSEKED